MFRDLVLSGRSYRRFQESERIDATTLKALIDLARCTPSAGNLQPLKYIISCTPEKNAKVFSCLAWAGYLTEWPGPSEGERPSGYIVVLGDTSIAKGFGCDHGIAAETILLGATELGLGGCIFGAINRDRLRSELGIHSQFEILLVIALGKPIEKVVLEDVASGGSIKYYRDEAQVHHVPKRKLEDIILDY